MEQPPELVVARHAPLARAHDVDGGQVEHLAVGAVEVLQAARVVVEGDRSRVGDQYTFVGYQARDGSPMAFLESLTGPDGKSVKIWFGDPNAN